MGGCQGTVLSRNATYTLTHLRHITKIKNIAWQLWSTALWDDRTGASRSRFYFKQYITIIFPKLCPPLATYHSNKIHIHVTTLPTQKQEHDSLTSFQNNNKQEINCEMIKMGYYWINSWKVEERNKKETFNSIFIKTMLDVALILQLIKKCENCSQI